MKTSSRVVGGRFLLPQQSLYARRWSVFAVSETHFCLSLVDFCYLRDWFLVGSSETDEEVGSFFPFLFPCFVHGNEEEQCAERLQQFAFVFFVFSSFLNE